jgi:hypothetical protein
MPPERGMLRGGIALLDRGASHKGGYLSE